MKKSLTAVAMSGGVDSSVAAALLRERGIPLVGFSMRLVDRLVGATESYGRCCSPDDFRDAAAVAQRLGFPHYVLNMEEEFERSVLRPFADDYARGRTPSPCIRCNTFVKFGDLLRRARAVGAKRLATGHYAILENDSTTGRTLLRRAADPEKDQSYFLFDLSEEQRRGLDFPLGTMSKEDVRASARRLGLAVAEKPESMDLCFVPPGDDYRVFLRREGLVPSDAPGEIVAMDGAVLGSHAGVSRFTVGQRRGLGIASGRPLYVVAIDAGTNRVQVGDDAALAATGCAVERVRWIPFERPSGRVRVHVKIRSTHPGTPAVVLDAGDGSAEVRFESPQRAVAPGQAAVFYDGDLVLGGGWIRDRSVPAARRRRLPSSPGRGDFDGAAGAESVEGARRGRRW